MALFESGVEAVRMYPMESGRSRGSLEVGLPARVVDGVIGPGDGVALGG